MARPKASFPEMEMLSLRLPPELRRDLQASADRNKRTLSVEIRRRLGDSVKGENEKFPTLELRALLRVIGTVMHSAATNACKRKGLKPTEWFDDPWCFDRVEEAAVLCLDTLRPEGEVVNPPPFRKDLPPHANWIMGKAAQNAGQTIARWILDDLLAAKDDDLLAQMRKQLTGRIVTRMEAGLAGSSSGRYLGPYQFSQRYIATHSDSPPSSPKKRPKTGGKK